MIRGFGRAMIRGFGRAMIRGFGRAMVVGLRRPTLGLWLAGVVLVGTTVARVSAADLGVVSAADLSVVAAADLGVASGAGLGLAAGGSGVRALVSSSQIHERPFRSLIMVTVGERVVCTGFVAAPRKVVTAAHCLTRDASRGDFRLRGDLPGSIRLYRGFSDILGGTDLASCGVSEAWAHPRFVRGRPRDDSFGSHAHDYAVLTTAPDCVYPQSAVMRMWPTSSFDGSFPAGSPVKLSGYPADGRFDDMNGLNLWRSRGEVMATDDPRLIDTTGFVAQGMSGGPIWSVFGAESPCGRSQCVVGILTECAVNGRGQCKLGDSLRRAVRITPTVKATISER